jgi:hypothetical protein
MQMVPSPGGYEPDTFKQAIRDSGIFSSIERRDSGPAHLDKTSDEYYAPESEVTDERVAEQDSLFGVLP